jgi:exodeoxyribonuclease VII large subunit
MVFTDRLRRHDNAVRIAATHRRLQSATHRLHRTTIQIVNTPQTRLNRAIASLEALSPLAVLSRGYALVYAADGTLLRSSTDTATGLMIRARLARGTLEAEVTRTRTDEAEVWETNHS